jgi:hypothetical protein
VLKRKFMSAVAVGAACLALTAGTAGTASAQVADKAPSTVKPMACSGNWWYIATSGVRIRTQPGGAIAGTASYGERVDIFWRSGAWVYVHFKNRPLYIHPRSGYVHQDSVQFRQSTCW